MSLLYNEGQEAIAIESKRVLDARTSTGTQLALLEQRGEFDREFWRTCIEQGWTALALPESVGGLGLSLVDLGIVAKAAGAAISGAPFLTTNFLVARALLDHADAALAGAWLPRLASGQAIGAVAFAEGSDAIPIPAKTVFANGSVTGVKRAVAGGIHADCALVFAESTLAFVPLDGVERTVIETFDNTRCVADLSFSGAPANVLVTGTAAYDAALHILALQAVVGAHEAVGGAEMLMFRARDYANTRRAFGQPIGAFQAVKHKIAELYVLVELARANAIHAASRDGQHDFVRAAAAARLSAVEAYDTAARDVVQIHGGIGVTWEAGLHLHQRRARTLAIEGGNTLFWEDVLVDQIQKDAA